MWNGLISTIFKFPFKYWEQSQEHLMEILANSTTLLWSVLVGLLLLAIVVDAFMVRRRVNKEQVELQQTVAELQKKLLSMERSLHSIGQRLLLDEKTIRELKDVPVRSLVDDALVNADYPGQIASWVEQESDRPESMTEAESLLHAMLKQRRVLAQA
jgi:peptide subunit release factor 1 (eRF1)